MAGRVVNISASPKHVSLRSSYFEMRNRLLDNGISNHDDSMTLEVFRELRLIRHALERLSPPSEDDQRKAKEEDSSFKHAFKELRSV